MPYENDKARLEALTAAARNRTRDAARVADALQMQSYAEDLELVAIELERIFQDLLQRKPEKRRQSSLMGGRMSR